MKNNAYLCSGKDLEVNRSKVRCSFTMSIFYAHTFTI